MIVDIAYVFPYIDHNFDHNRLNFLFNNKKSEKLKIITALSISTAPIIDAIDFKFEASIDIGHFVRIDKLCNKLLELFEAWNVEA